MKVSNNFAAFQGSFRVPGAPVCLAEQTEKTKESPPRPSGGEGARG